MKETILLSAFACNPNKGTEPGSGWSWAYHYAQSGFNVICITNIFGKKDIEYQLNKGPIYNLKFVFIKMPIVMDLLLKAQFPIFIYPYYLLWQLKAYKFAKRNLPFKQFDFIHHVTYGSIVMGSHLWKLNRPFIFGPVGGGQKYPKAFYRYLGKGLMKEIFRNFFKVMISQVFSNSKRTLKNAKIVLVTNEETRELAYKLGAKNIRYFLDSGIPDKSFPKYEHMIRQKGPHTKLLWVGSMQPIKGLFLLLEVMKELRENKEINLTLVGDGPSMKEIIKFLIKNKLEKVVNCVGRVPFSKVVEYYKKHDIFIFPSLRESFGVQLLEAMSYGLPIITMDHQGSKVFVPDNVGIKISVTNPEKSKKEMISAIQLLHTNTTT